MFFPQALALEFGERGAEASHDGSLADNSNSAAAADSTFYEITVATVDQPKLLSRLSDAMVSSSGQVQYPAAQQHTAIVVQEAALAAAGLTMA